VFFSITFNIDEKDFVVNHGLRFIANAERLLFPVLRAVLDFRGKQSPKSPQVYLHPSRDYDASECDCSSHHLLSAIGNSRSCEDLRTQFALGVEPN
jgi:hypothetical protein